MLENTEIPEKERMGKQPTYSVSVDSVDLYSQHIFLRLRNLPLSCTGVKSDPRSIPHSELLRSALFTFFLNSI